MKFAILVLLMPFFYGVSCAQNNELTWEELRERYEFPQWYTEARFGIWVHWGAQTQPEEGGGWYASHMYKQNGAPTWGANAYPYHNKTYGHPSEKGFKDVIHEWKAENLDTDALIKYFKGIGAKYFMAMANHHDHFDNFNSTHHPWNSVNVGPKRDIIGEFSESAKKYEIPFGVSSHDDRFLKWFLPAFGSDTYGHKKGIPYDGRLTKEDGKGKWWEGLDPAGLYGLPPEKRPPGYQDQIGKNFMLRHQELVTKYDVDMIWFDGGGFPYGEYGKEACRTLFNNSLRKHGEITAVVAGKFRGEPSTVADIERGGALEILPHPWQGTLTFTHWFYKTEIPSRHNARTVIENMVDVNSKNGNLLLNVELLPDGTIPPDHKAVLDEIGTWVNLHGEAIYASKPWKIFGDNLNSIERAKNIENADVKAVKKKSNHFNARTIASQPYGHDEVRFTTNKDKLYVFVLNPKEGKIEIPSLGLNSEFAPQTIRSIKLIGSKAKIEFKQDEEKLTLIVPEKRPNQYTSVFEVKGAL